MTDFRTVYATAFGHIRYCPELRDVEVRLGNVVVAMPLYRYRELRDLIYRAAASASAATEVEAILQSSTGQFRVVLGSAELRDAVALFQVADLVLQAEGIVGEESG